MSTPKLYWLVAGQIITASKTGAERTRNMNAIVMSETPKFTRQHIDNAHKGLAQRFLTGAPQIPGHKIIDIFIVSVSLLGEMTPEEFHEGFPDQPGSEPVEGTKAKELN